jgi:hypothetical protein
MKDRAGAVFGGASSRPRDESIASTVTEDFATGIPQPCSHSGQPGWRAGSVAPVRPLRFNGVQTSVAQHRRSSTRRSVVRCAHGAKA